MISCQQYDYIEIACMYKFPVIITLKDGESAEGIAQDTKTNEKQEECIVLKTEGKEELIVLDKISKMEVQIENPHFKFVEFL